MDEGFVVIRKGSDQGYGWGRSASTGVSAARLHQKSGTEHSFGGYTKVSRGNGVFAMKKTGESR